MSTLQADFLVVGGGIAGLSVAGALSQGGQFKVLVIEMEAHPGYHATGRSAAILVEGYGTPIVRKLTALSRPLLEREDDLPGGILRSRGILYVALKGAAPTQVVESGGSISRIAATTACDLVPALNLDAIDHAFHDPTAADIDVHALLTRYLRTLKAGDGEIITNSRLTSANWTGNLWRVVAGEHQIEAKVVINAAGAWAREVGNLFQAQDIALEPRRRSAAIVSTDSKEDPGDWPMVVDLAETVYFKPEAGKLLVSPADETPSQPCDAFPDDLDIAYAVDRFEKLTRLKVRRVTHSWAGLRTFAPDGNPVLGRDCVAPNFYWNAGQGGVGVQTSPITAQILASQILGGLPPIDHDMVDLAQLTPQRFMPAAATNLQQPINAPKDR